MEHHERDSRQWGLGAEKVKSLVVLIDRDARVCETFYISFVAMIVLVSVKLAHHRTVCYTSLAKSRFA